MNLTRQVKNLDSHRLEAFRVFRSIPKIRGTSGLPDGWSVGYLRGPRFGGFLMRFVFLTLGYAPDLDGGGYRYATEVAELLAARGHEVHAVYPNPGDWPARERRSGVELHRVERGTGGFRTRWKAAHRRAREVVRSLLADPQPLLLFSHHAYLARAVAGLPYVMILQGPWALEHRFSLQAKPRTWLRRALDGLVCQVMHRVERQAVAQARQVFVASEYSRSRLAEWHVGLNPAVEVIGGGADLNRFQPPPNRSALRRERGLTESEFLFLAVRRLDPRMGLLHLVDAFAEIAARHPRARLAIAGKGAQRTELESRIAAAGLTGRVQLLGFVAEKELPGVYASADCVIMPSLDLEGFGLATAEALACGTPVLASRAGANPELVQPLGQELLFEPADAASLAAALAGVLDGSRRLPDRSECAAYARSAFRWDRPADAIERAHEHFAVSGWPEGMR